MLVCGFKSAGIAPSLHVTAPVLEVCSGCYWSLTVCIALAHRSNVVTEDLDRLFSRNAKSPAATGSAGKPG